MTTAVDDRRPALPPEGHLSRVVENSRIVRIVDGFFEATSAAWRRSRVCRAGAALVTYAAPTGESVAVLVGWMMLSAITTRIMILGVPTPGDPLSGAGWLAATPFALACILRPRKAAAAWNAWIYRWRVPRRRATATMLGANHPIEPIRSARSSQASQ